MDRHGGEILRIGVRELLGQGVQVAQVGVGRREFDVQFRPGVGVGREFDEKVAGLAAGGDRLGGMPLKFQRDRLENESLTDYVLIAQNVISVEHYYRDPQNRWIFEGWVELSDVLRRLEIEPAIVAERIYDRVKVQPPSEV